MNQVFSPLLWCKECMQALDQGGRIGKKMKQREKLHMYVHLLLFLFPSPEPAGAFTTALNASLF